LWTPALVIFDIGKTIEMGGAPEIVSSGALKIDREESILSFKKVIALLS